MNTNNTNTVTENTAAEIDISSLDNKGVVEQIRALTAERKAKHDAVVAAVEKLWAEYTEWRDTEYRTRREALFAQLGANRDAKIAKREERKAEALKRAQERKDKAEAKLAALEANKKKPEEEVPAEQEA